ncbi:hypothetical protein LGQ02_02835 [Bacillus shivajii]|uniref:hypothetical protein n=1 Tax=Bacillus shivajii TaxID=1983719 RepID=UPI001CF9D4C0|nr:hypothetical protein [Bacillus shivajii]UCZ53740.1 hypothetical protein LGQ02_02835 [Bacillus shivajii]
MANSEIKRMTSAYELLYEIETSLKDHVSQTLSKTYGNHWPIVLKDKKRFEKVYFHDLIVYYGKYPPLDKFFSLSQRKKLYRLTNVRNKIAHMHHLSSSDYELLTECHQLVFQNLRNGKASKEKTPPLTKV